MRGNLLTSFVRSRSAARHAGVAWLLLFVGGMNRGLKRIAALMGLLGCGCLGQAPNPSVMPAPDADVAPPEPTIPDPPFTQTSPFEPIPPVSYVTRVKNLMTGLAPTDDEVQAVVADPNALRGLVDQWMELPQFHDKMLDFFRNAFQQNRVTNRGLEISLGIPEAWLWSSYANEGVGPTERDLMDSFPRTVWALIQEKRPFTEALTTRRFMLNTAQMALLSYVDELQVDDKEVMSDRRNGAAPWSAATFDPLSTVPLSASLDPTSPSYLTFALSIDFPASCTTRTPLVRSDPNRYLYLWWYLWGFGPYDPCASLAFTPFKQSAFTAADHSDWRMVTIHQTDATTPNTTPRFWSVYQLRAAGDLILHTPRVGFSGTLAFQANWPSNAANEARVTANQTLIVAIGRSINPTNVKARFGVNDTDAMHASSASCKGCHSRLDPLKQYVRQSYSVYYHDQSDATVVAQPAGFDIDGVQATGQGIADLQATLAKHPRFALAWAQKLQFWANSMPAQEDDPELLRIAKAFADSGFDWKTLVRELFTSPLVTFAAATQTSQANGILLSIARRDHLCAALSNRLGVPDACGLKTAAPSARQTAIGARASVIAVDGYTRAAELPSLPTNPDLFFRGSAEEICRLVADQVIDGTPGPSRYASADTTSAITDFVSTVMGITASDPRRIEALEILTDHFVAVRSGAPDGGAPASVADALKSTFILACTSPSSVLTGL
jgi:hypothetical protein